LLFEFQNLFILFSDLKLFIIKYRVDYAGILKCTASFAVNFLHEKDHFFCFVYANFCLGSGITKCIKLCLIRTVVLRHVLHVQWYRDGVCNTV